MSVNEKAKNIQAELTENAQKIWLAGLGALTVAGEEGSKLFKSLVEKGESFQKKEKGTVDSVKKSVGSIRGQAEDLWHKIEDAIQDRVSGTLQKMGVPSREEIAQLNQRVDALMAAIDKLNASQHAAKGDDAAKKTTAKK